VLFFTEMWERFNYYGMRALLVLYMVKYYKWTQEDASRVYKWYTSLVYLTPLLGGFLADRYLGNKTAVIIGALLMAIGEFLLVLDPYLAFYTGLVFLIIGNGFFKPNMSTQVGRLYPANDGRRDGAYTIFYMGINLGAFLSPLICGWLAENTTWAHHAGFAVAGIGMLLGLITYLVGLPLVIELPPDAMVSATQTPARTEGAPATATAEGEPSKGPEAPPAADRPPTEEEAERIPSAVGWLNR
jgi:POT family proton-dependent oligopeptide transporter